MARSLSQTLSRLTPPSSAFSSAACARRLRSNLSENTEETEIIAIKKLEDAIHRIIVKRSEPDWLPLVPGSSYWVPPRSKARGVAQMIGKLLNSSSNTFMSRGQALSLTYDRGWPSSAHFLKEASHSSMEVETHKKQASQSEDEEG